MNKWLERALISAGAAVVSTTAIVTTAERPGKRKKRKKKKGEESRGKDGALVDDDVPRSIGAQAAHDYRVGHDGGITPREFFANVRDAGKNAARRASTVGGYLLGKQQPPPPADAGEEALDEAPQKAKAKPGAKKVRKKVRKRVRRGEAERARESASATQKKRRPAKGRSDFDELRDEAVKRAASAAAKHAADKTGLGDAAGKLKESSAEVWKKAEQLGKAVKERVPEDLGERASTTLGEAGKGIARGARALSERLRAALSEEEQQARAERSDDVEGSASPSGEPVGSDEVRGDNSQDEAPGRAEDGERIGSAFKGFARWMEGPGAPRDDDGERRPGGRVRRATTDDVVEARDPSSATPPDVVEPKDPPEPPPDIVEAKDPPDGP